MCTHCGAPLEQLGHLDGSTWVPENLWRCPGCAYGRNRFTVLHGHMTQATPDMVAALP
jgi:hypothetical protein